MTGEILYIILNIASIVLTSAVNYGMIKARVDNLEKKVDKHNSVMERTFVLEGKVKELEKTVHKKR